MSRKDDHERISSMAGLDADGALLPPVGVGGIDREPQPFWRKAVSKPSAPKRAPTPWRAWGSYLIVDANGDTVAQSPEGFREQIIEAVNAYENPKPEEPKA